MAEVKELQRLHDHTIKARKKVAGVFGFAEELEQDNNNEVFKTG